MAKKVSIILVNYNGMPHIDVCISSVLNQTYQDFEVIFVDNASSDESLEHARSSFPNLLIVANNKNLGYAGGINSGLAYASGEYIAPLNIDTEVDCNWLSAMVSFLDTNPQAAAVTPRILLFDDRNKVNAMGLDIHVTGLGFCRGLGKNDNAITYPVRVDGVSGCSYLIRREILERMGGAPEECFMGNDDVIVSWLINLMGFEMYCVPDAVVYHKYSQKMEPDKLFRLEKNRQALLLSSLEPLTLIVLSPVFIAVEFMIVLYSLIKGKAYLRAKLDAFASLWRERDNIEQKKGRYRQLRKLSDFALLRRLSWNLAWNQLWNILR